MTIDDIKKIVNELEEKNILPFIIDGKEYMVFLNNERRWADPRIEMDREIVELQQRKELIL